MNDLLSLSSVSYTTCTGMLMVCDIVYEGLMVMAILRQMNINLTKVENSLQRCRKTFEYFKLEI